MTTTLRVKFRSAVFLAFTDVVDRVLYSADLLGVFVRDLDVEGLFESHDQLDRVEGVSGQIVEEVRLQDYFPALACLPM